MTLRRKGMLREPQAINKRPGGPRTPKILNLQHCCDTPVVNIVHLKAQATCSRRSRPNVQPIQVLYDAPVSYTHLTLPTILRV